MASARLASGLASGKPFGNRTLIELWSSIDASAAASAALHPLARGRHRLGIVKRQITRRSLDFAAAIQAIDPKPFAVASQIADCHRSAVCHVSSRFCDFLNGTTAEPWFAAAEAS